MFGSEKLKFQVLIAVSRFGTSIHPLSASLENALSGKNKILKFFVVVEGYKKWFCIFHIFATRAIKKFQIFWSTQIARQVAIYYVSRR
jgi:hypothetical protein